MRRSWDRDGACWMVRVLPGEYYVTQAGEGISTVLGSCVAACVRDTELGIGGLNHFMLPEDTSSGQSPWMQPESGMATRYGTFAMEKLIQDTIDLGARKDRLEFKLFGGGRILPSMTDVGAANVAFVRNFMARHNFRIAAEDLGDCCPRRIVFYPATGRVLVKRLRSFAGQAIGNRELAHLEGLAHARDGAVRRAFD
ncbi:MAG: chemoreceptor glutamine deamidase CheD [Gammaproteobacteria bacterium]|nr:MAG: chemoreceptor glutamine deamidase CheD [Gammaproteobacteria bacterium]